MKEFAEAIVSIVQLLLLAVGVGAVLGLTLAVAFSVFMWWIK
nr:MAG TPA: transmembrane domain protein [Caudoviricetes sp.]